MVSVREPIYGGHVIIGVSQAVLCGRCWWKQACQWNCHATKSSWWCMRLPLRGFRCLANPVSCCLASLPKRMGGGLGDRGRRNGQSHRCSVHPSGKHLSRSLRCTHGVHLRVHSVDAFDVRLFIIIVVLMRVIDADSANIRNA